MLSRDDILKADDRAVEEIEVPEWGGTVRVATMSGATRDRFESSLLVNGKADVSNAHAKLVAASVVDADGQPLFSASDIEALGQKSAAALNRIVAVARRLNRLGEQELEDARGN